jgi:hypothetical protein
MPEARCSYDIVTFPSKDVTIAALTGEEQRVAHALRSATIGVIKEAQALARGEITTPCLKLF